MIEKKYLRVVFPIAIIGTMFSGYTVLVKAFLKICAFNEECPMFLGHPACYFGFGIFSSLLLVSGFAFFERIPSKWAISVNAGISLAGVLFAGYFVIQEMMAGPLTGYMLGLPSCVYGLAFYVVIFVLSMFAWMTGKRK